MTKQEKLNEMWVDSQTKKLIKEKRNIGTLITWLKQLKEHDSSLLQKVLDSGLLTQNELSAAGL